MATVDPAELAEVEEIEPEQLLTEKELKALPTDPTQLYGEVEPPVERGDIWRLVAWLTVFAFMISFLFAFPWGLIVSGVIGVGASATSLYYRNKQNTAMGYVPFIGAAGLLLIAAGVIMTMVWLALHSAPAPGTDYFNGTNIE